MASEDYSNNFVMVQTRRWIRERENFIFLERDPKPYKNGQSRLFAFFVVLPEPDGLHWRKVYLRLRHNKRGTYFVAALGKDGTPFDSVDLSVLETWNLVKDSESIGKPLHQIYTPGTPMRGLDIPATNDLVKNLRKLAKEAPGNFPFKHSNLTRDELWHAKGHTDRPRSNGDIVSIPRNDALWWAQCNMGTLLAQKVDRRKIRGSALYLLYLLTPIPGSNNQEWLQTPLQISTYFGYWHIMAINDDRNRSQPMLYDTSGLDWLRKQSHTVSPLLPHHSNSARRAADFRSALSMRVVEGLVDLAKKHPDVRFPFLSSLIEHSELCNMALKGMPHPRGFRPSGSGMSSKHNSQRASTLDAYIHWATEHQGFLLAEPTPLLHGATPGSLRLSVLTGPGDSSERIWRLTPMRLRAATGRFRLARATYGSEPIASERLAPAKVALLQGRATPLKRLVNHGGKVDDLSSYSGDVDPELEGMLFEVSNGFPNTERPFSYSAVSRQQLLDRYQLSRTRELQAGVPDDSAQLPTLAPKFEFLEAR